MNNWPAINFLMNVMQIGLLLILGYLVWQTRGGE
jgi:hypothetical protein